MFDRILVANRGEIACRVIRTAKRLGIKTVAVYSEADAAALHVSRADEAFAIGPAPARDSYLVIEKLIAVAQGANAGAIHPGYGFLSENADFARVCNDNGIVFIGPPAEAIEAMGSKSVAKRIMQEARVPVVPGYHGDKQDEKSLLKEAEKVGFPIMIKASAGGGGKGLRVVDGIKAFGDALRSARREALASFGNDKVLIEKCLARPRHIEIQVFCDHHGNAVHLFERDCSIQRRHQKVLEEAPAPGMDNEKRAAMGHTAVAAAKAIGYAGAGTVEFIVDEDGTFYFMEMNTRLQVEHPVTELITHQDLVEWQLLVAAGEPLPVGQAQLSIDGHALEARIYAEDPANQFLPATGRLNRLRFPTGSTHVRVDTGVRQGDSITIHYDPLIAKLIAWDSDRVNCLRRMDEALRQTHVAGVTTNIDFLASVISHEAFQSAGSDTGFIERHQADLLLDASFRNLYRQRPTSEYTPSSPDPTSPWQATDNWQLNLPNEEQVKLHDGAREREPGPSRTGPRLSGESRLLAPMPGRIIEIAASEGQQVKQGDTLLILEAMKMEHAVTAPHDGVVRSLCYATGDTVEEGVELTRVSVGDQ